MPAKRKRKYTLTTHDVLRQILLAINSAEGCETDLEMTVVTALRDALYEFKNRMGVFIQTNEDLEQFDKVFTECGWDNQGFRYLKENPEDDAEQVFVVEISHRICSECGQKHGSPIWKIV